MMRALAVRVGVSVLLFVCILLAWSLGWIHPTGIPLGQLSGAAAQRRSRALAAGARSEPVDHDVQAEPDDVDEVPVPGRAFEAEVALGREVALA